MQKNAKKCRQEKREKRQGKTAGRKKLDPGKLDPKKSAGQKAPGEAKRNLQKMENSQAAPGEKLAPGKW